jgi:drug/metabolite transporter (DMT)-like permease
MTAGADIGLRRYASVGLAVGALGVSASSVFIKLADTSPTTTTFFRCLLALPLLVPFAAIRGRSEGRMSRRVRVVTIVAGVLFAGDMLWWAQAILEIGAGLSTVVVNLQVVLVPLLAWIVDREPISRRFLLALPFLVLGLVLASGALGGGTGSAPVWGTIHSVLAAVCYSGYLFLLRRVGKGGQVAQSYRDVIVTAAVTALLVGWLGPGIDLRPSWVGVGWLLAVAVCGQVIGWLLVAYASPRLPSHIGATLLLLTPVGAVALGALVLGERPTLPQLAGCALILVGGYAISVHRQGAPRSR